MTLLSWQKCSMDTVLWPMEHGTKTEKKVPTELEFRNGEKEGGGHNKGEMEVWGTERTGDHRRI